MDKKGSLLSNQPDQNPITLKGQYIAKLYGPNGELKQEMVGDNLVCTNGKEFLASFLYSAAAAASTFTGRYLAVGTDSTSPAVGNTALGTELTRASGIVSYVSNQIFQVKATFATGVGTGAIVEYGLFTSSTGGTLISRDVDSVINKGANDTLTVTYQMTVN